MYPSGPITQLTDQSSGVQDLVPAGQKRPSYLERKLCLDFLSQDFGDNPVKVRENLHGQLGLNSSFVDQVIESVSERQTDTVEAQAIR